VKRSSQDRASQPSQEAAAARLKVSKKGKGRKTRKSIPITAFRRVYHRFRVGIDLI
jgi:hypothetical protein